MSLKTLIISGILIGLFAISFIMFSINIGLVNGANHTIADDSDVESLRENYSTSLESYRDKSAEAIKTIGNSTPALGSDSLIFESAPQVTLSIMDMPEVIWDVTIGFIGKKLLGDRDQLIIINVIGAMLVVLIGLYVIKMMRTGDID